MKDKMNSMSNDDQSDDSVEAPGNMKLGRKEVVGSFYRASAALSEIKPFGQTQNAEEQSKSTHAQKDGCGKLDDNIENDLPHHSERINGSHEAQIFLKREPLSLSTPELPSSPLKSTSSSPTQPERAPASRQVMHEASQERNSRQSNQRTRLLIFIKVILKYLDCEDPSLQFEAKQIIKECTRKNREGILGYDPLADAITSQLRLTVGEVHWNRAKSLTSHYLKTRPRNNLTIDKLKFAQV